VIALTLAEVAAATGGSLADGADPAARVTGPVEFDSRRSGPGGLFAAVRGERADGHDFAAAAIAAGAVAVLAARPVGVPAVVVSAPSGAGSSGATSSGATSSGAGSGPASPGPGASPLSSDPVVIALGRLARAVLDRLPDVVVVGVTGSSGKTSTKDLLAHLLAQLGPTVAPTGSFNNELGHPITVLQVDETTRHLVVECSARGEGHIATLCRIAPPRVGVELNVGSAHLGEFGSREAIARAKGELVEALPPAAAGGVAVLNADDPLVAAMASRTAARVVTTGRSPQADVHAGDVELDALGRPSYTLSAGGQTAPVRLGLHGEHQVGNSLAAAAVALELGLALPEVAAALGTARPASRWRMEVTERRDGVTVINDAYNANPESMAAALQALAAMGAGRRTWAVLGPMAELGEDGDDEHDRIGRLAVRLNVSRLVVVGAAAGRIHAAAVVEGSWGEESVHVPDLDTALVLLGEQLLPGDVVLVKASRSAGLERVALALTGEAT